MQSRQKIDNHADGRLPWINDLERNQPAGQDIGQKRPNIDIYDLVD
jgi:hypothetical protein